MVDVNNPFGSPSEDDSTINEFDFEVPSNKDISNAIPEGSYVLALINVFMKKSKSGKPMTVWEFIVAEGEFKKTTFTDQKGSALYIVNTPETAWKKAEVAKALGIVDDIEDKPVNVKIVPSELRFTLCEAEIEKTKYEGRDTNNIKFLKASDPPGKKIDPKTLLIEDDDIPF